MLSKIIIFLISTVCLPPIIRSESTYETCVASRQQSQKPAKIFIDLEAPSYYDLIRNSEVFVDNTLFIQEVFNKHGQTEKPSFKCNSTLYTVPRNNGKTINLDMLKSFLEIEVNKDGIPIPKEMTTGYKLFRDGVVTFNQNKLLEILNYDKTQDPLTQPLLISNNKELINKYQGQIPVIFISFSKVGENGNDFATVQNDIILAFKKAFEQHIYLKNVFKNETFVKTITQADIDAYVKVVDEKNVHYSSHQIVSFVQSLSKILYKLFNRKPFLLLDDYDRPLYTVIKSKTITEQEIETVFQYVGNITAAIFQPQHEYIEQAIATGYFKLESHIHRSGPFCRYIDVTRGEPPIGEYFGIRQKDLHAIFSRRKLDNQTWEKVHQWYKVRHSTISQQYVYNPKSVINFLNDNTIGIHSASVTDREYMLDVIEAQPTIRNSILLFISRHKKMTIRNIFTKALYSFHAINLKEMRLNKKMKLDWHIREIFYRYIFGRGYLTAIEDQTPFRYPPILLTQVANSEILSEMIGWMITFYEQHHKINDKFVIDAGTHLRKYLLNVTASPEDLEKSLETVFKRGSPNSLNETQYFKALFNNVVLRLQRDHILDLEVYYEKTLEVDIVICDRVSQTGLAIEVQGFRTPDDVLEEALKYYAVFDRITSFVKSIRYVGVSVNPSRAVRIVSKLVTNETRTTTPEPDPWDVDLSNAK